MDFIIIKNKKYKINKFGKGGNNNGYIIYSKTKIGKIIYLSEERKINKKLDTEYFNENP